MLLICLTMTALAVLINIIYFKTKKDKVLIPVFSSVVFSVMISAFFCSRLGLIPFVKLFAVLSLLHICSVNDIIRRESDDIFQIAIIIISFIANKNIVYSLISFGIITVFFLLLVVFSKKTIGGGDIKMICALTAFFGIYNTLLSVSIACIAGILYALISKFVNKLPDFSRHFAFLPFVEVGYFVTLLLTVR